MSRIWKILLDPHKLEPPVGDTLTRISGQFQGGGVIRLSLVMRLVDLLPVAQRTNALTTANSGPGKKRKTIGELSRTVPHAACLPHATTAALL